MFVIASYVNCSVYADRRGGIDIFDGVDRVAPIQRAVRIDCVEFAVPASYIDRAVSRYCGGRANLMASCVTPTSVYRPG